MKRLAVVGVGLIGGSIGLAAHRSLEGVEVVGHDLDRTALSAALERGAIDRASDSLAEAVAGASACFVCVPVGSLRRLIDDLLATAGPDCLVTDVGSTKRAVVVGVADERFIGGHPIAGAEASGVDAARPDLFDGATWYLTPSESSAGILYDRLHRLLVAFGARPVAIDAVSHDRLLATVSHLPHVLANVLVEQAVRTASEEEEALPRVGPSFRDLTRVAGASSSIWTDIYITNAEAIVAAIDETTARLEGVARMLRRSDADALKRWNDDARSQRKRLLEAEAAAGPVQELRVVVPNRPGIVAELALSLGRGGVNIVDMALAPASDNRSGAVSFWVAGERSAARARELLEPLGFPLSAPA